MRSFVLNMRGRVLHHSALAVSLLLSFAPAARAWSNHTLCTWQAVGMMPEISGRTVTAEPFTTFLDKEAAGLAVLLADEERWARASLAFYAPRPDALAFVAPVAPIDPSALRLSFFHAIRVNENMPLELFVQREPGIVVPDDKTMPWSDLTVLKSEGDLDRRSLQRVAPGDELSAADVVATGSNDPDLGYDIGLWQDNGQKQGALYGFGPQPFGNPLLDYGSQAPFHMGFYHEAAIIYSAAGYLQHTYPEARVHLYMALAHYAFTHGHAYWGWRFAGWAIHYVQDLGQPYHARVLPGVSAPAMLWVSALDMAGLHHARMAALSRVTDRHLVLENYQYRRMVVAYEHHDANDALLAALRDTSDDATLQHLLSASLRDTVSAQSAAAADALDAQIARSFPGNYVSSDTTIEDSENLDFYAIASQAPPAEQARLSALIAARMRQVGRDTRAVIRALVTNGSDTR